MKDLKSLAGSVLISFGVSMLANFVYGSLDARQASVCSEEPLHQNND